MLTRWAVMALTLLLFQASPSFGQTDSQLKVRIEGVSAAQEQNIRGFLSIQPLHDKGVASRSRLRYLHNKAGAEIRQALQPFGFYRPQITASLTEQDNGWLAHYQIDPGPTLPIARLDIQLRGEAQTDPVFSRLLSESTLRVGNPLIHSEYEALKRQLRSLAAERGYYRASWLENRVEVDLDRYQASIYLHFDSGPRFRVGEILFTPSPLSTDFLRRYVPFQRGDAVQTSTLVDLQTALIDSDYFQQVEVKPLWDRAEGTEVPIEVDVKAHKRTRYRSGIGYGTDTGIRGKLGMTRRWVNSRGHQFNAQLLGSEIRNSLTTEYSIPGFNPQVDRYAVRLSLSSENSDTVDSSNRTLGVSWLQQGRWQRTLALEWQQEQFRFGDDTRESQFLVPRISFSRIATQDRLKVRDGHRLAIELLGASDVLLSDTDFVQLRLSGKRVHSLTDNLRLLGRAEAGLTVADDFDTLPASLRFFAGGDNSVRGYDYQSLGPKNSDGDVVGGPYQLVASAELDYRFKDNWAVAAFIDAGDAFEESDIQLRTGIGVGLRWFSPIGPVRFDIAAPQGSGASGLRLHFSLGPDL